MTRPQQKEHELAAARLFVESARMAATPLDHGECPDVLLEFAGGERVLLEVTSAVEARYREAHEALKRVERATEALLAGERLFVQVVHHSNAWLKADRKHEQRVAEALASFVRGMMARGVETVRSDDDDMPQGFPVELAGFAWAIQAWPSDETSVHASGEQYHGAAPTQRVQDILSDKESRVPEYRERDPDAPIWLLIATHTAIAERLIPDLLDIKHEFASSFDRAFLLDGALRKVRELRIGRRVDREH